MARALRPRGGKVRTFLGVILLLIGSGGRSVAAGQESLDIEQIAAERDLYAVLDLQPGAEAFDIKAAYRKLAKKWHPDKNPDDTQTAQAKFAEIAEAYEVLSDETSRQLYDHARRVRAAHDHPNSAGGAGAGAGAGAARDTAPDWYYDGMGWDWDDFGSSFSGGGGAGVGAGAGAGAGFGEAFGSGLFGGGGGGGARMGGDGGGGGAYIFRTRDPMELFEAFFGGGVFDVDVDGGSPEAEFYYSQDPYEFHQHQYQHQHQQQQQQQRQRQGASWDGQDFEQYQDYEDGGQMYRRVITTKAYLDGTQQSTAQDFLFDKLRDAWFEKTGSFEYHGPGVAPVGECCGGNGRGDHPVDNVLRMGEFLRVGHSISSIDRRFAAVLESDCNLVVYHSRGGGKEVKVWETNSYSSEGVCFAAIQDNGMLVVMAGTDPTAPGNVLWSTNRGRVGWMWVQDTAFHAAVLPSGNLVVSQGESPMHPAARRCVWGAFGCPGDGSVLEWKLVWMSFRSKAGDIWCKVVGCDWADDYSYSGAGSGGFPPRGKSGSDVEGGGGFRGGDLLTQPAAAFKKAAEQGVAWLSDALAKLKAAAEDTAYAASRPRHW